MKAKMLSPEKDKKNINHIPMDASEKVAEIIAYVVLVLLALMAILPCLHVIS